MAQLTIPTGSGAGKVYPARPPIAKPKATAILTTAAKKRAQVIANRSKAVVKKQAVVPAAGNTQQPTTPNPSQTTGSGFDISKVHSYNDLQKEAQSQIDSETAGAIAPLTSAQGQLGTREQQARGEIEGLFGELQPYAVDSANRLRDANSNLASTEKNIMAQTAMRLNSLRQSAAQDAQNLAQQMGGPVAMDSFTGGVDPAVQQQAGLGGGLQLYSAALGEGQVGRAEQFAGGVLPAVEHQDEVSSTNNFEAQRQKLQDQITSLQAAKSGKTNDRLNQLITQERQYQLQKTTERQNQIKLNQATKAQNVALRDEQIRTGLAQRELGIRQIGVKQAGQRLRQENVRISNQAYQAAARLGVSKAQLNERIRADMATEGARTRQLNIAQQRNAIAMAKAVTNPTGGKPVGVTQMQYVPPNSTEHGFALANLGKGKYHMDNKGRIFYWQHRTLTQAQLARQAGVTQAMNTPQGLYKTLRRQGVKPSQALMLARQYTNSPGWSPGK